MISIVRTVVACLVAALSGCTSTSVTPVTPPSTSVVPIAELVGTWSLDQLDEKHIQPRQVTVQFGADGSYRASVACNEIGARYTVRQDIVMLMGPLRGTEKGCVPPPVYEDLITNALYGVGGPWTARFDGRDHLKLFGRYQLILSRVRS